MIKRTKIVSHPAANHQFILLINNQSEMKNACVTFHLGTLEKKYNKSWMVGWWGDGGKLYFFNDREIFNRKWCYNVRVYVTQHMWNYIIVLLLSVF